MSSEVFPYISNRRDFALSLSASERGIDSMSFVKDVHGKPLSDSGRFWSLSDNIFEGEKIFVGVVHTEAIGIDFEFIRKRSDLLLAQYDASNLTEFYRIWTAKEAAFKAWNKGTRIDADMEYFHHSSFDLPIVNCGGTIDFLIYHFQFGSFIASIACETEIKPIWRMCYACTDS